jgi:L-alanine-DL-glutamate epimerase-like enolase superfamily enzyme
LDAYVAEPLRIEDGFAIAPDRAGHGIAFDWERLQAIRA